MLKGGAYKTEEVVWLVAGDRDKFGDATFTEQTVRARVDRKNRRVMSQSGAEAVSKCMLRVDEKPDMADRFRVDGEDWTILQVSDVKAIAHVVGYEVFLG